MSPLDTGTTTLRRRSGLNSESAELVERLGASLSTMPAPNVPFRSVTAYCRGYSTGEFGGPRPCRVKTPNVPGFLGPLHREKEPCGRESSARSKPSPDLVTTECASHDRSLASACAATYSRSTAKRERLVVLAKTYSRILNVSDKDGSFVKSDRHKVYLLQVDQRYPSGNNRSFSLGKRVRNNVRALLSAHDTAPFVWGQTAFAFSCLAYYHSHHLNNSTLAVHRERPSEGPEQTSRLHMFRFSLRNSTDYIKVTRSYAHDALIDQRQVRRAYHVYVCVT